MTDLMDLSDPAAGLTTDRSRLRAMVDDRIGGSARPTPASPHARRPWRLALAGFAVIVIAVAIPAFLLDDPGDLILSGNGFLELPGVERTVPLASGGVQTGAVDGDTIWIVTALQNKLQKISARSGEVLAIYEIGAHVEGVQSAAGHLWLMSYDNGGEVLRFDPTSGSVDMAIPLGGLPAGDAWFDGSLWVSTDRSELLQISADGVTLSTQPGQVKGTGFGFLWVNDPTTNLISSLSTDGVVGEVVIPTDGVVTPTGADIREVTEAAGYLWLTLAGSRPTAVVRFELETSSLQPLPVATEPWGATEYGGYLWMTSRFDNLLVRVDPTSGDVLRYPLPGKPGGILIADGALWVALYQPGSLLRLDITADLIETVEPITYGGTNGHHLVCTGGDPTTTASPTVILEPEAWMNYGSWSLVQALISEDGYRVCADGYLDGDPGPEQRSADLARDLAGQGIAGPYLLVASGDGVHTVRLFASGRSDIVGVVLVDPTPLGFQTFYDSRLSEIGVEGGHAPWLDLPIDVSKSLKGFGTVPLVVIGQDPDATYLSDRFTAFAGTEIASSINEYWQEGLAFYRTLSSDSRSMTALGTGSTGIILSHPEIVVRQVLSVLDRATAK
ncbi:MAG: hypothetical protein JJE47_00770 [Acidimicrobiia bacterium]|nr:hypothetical protein [Acidimicrobiia bacterium]